MLPTAYFIAFLSKILVKFAGVFWSSLIHFAFIRVAPRRLVTPRMSQCWDSLTTKYEIKFIIFYRYLTTWASFITSSAFLLQIIILVYMGVSCIWFYKWMHEYISRASLPVLTFPGWLALDLQVISLSRSVSV